jgi:hypothetical protein
MNDDYAIRASIQLEYEAAKVSRNAPAGSS